MLEEKLDEYKNIMKDENDIKRRIGEFKSIFKKKNILTEFDSVVFNSITDKIIIGEKDEFDVLDPNVIKFVFRNGKEVKQALPRKLNSKQTVIEKYAEEIRKQQSSASTDEKNIIQVKMKALNLTPLVQIATTRNTVLASPRGLIAFLENNVQKDGSILVPKALQPYMGGKEVIKPNK